MDKRCREMIFNKYGGRCAYCGCELHKGWHVDHLQPIYRNFNSTYCMRPQNENKENLMPSCGSCNNYKNTMDIETFRDQVGLLVSRLNSTFTQYKIAKRFGLIEEIKKPIIFYFEQFKTRQPFAPDPNSKRYKEYFGAKPVSAPLDKEQDKIKEVTGLLTDCKNILKGCESTVFGKTVINLKIHQIETFLQSLTKEG